MYRFVLNKLFQKFSDRQVIETGLSDFYKMNLTLLQMYFTKKKHETSAGVIKNMMM